MEYITENILLEKVKKGDSKSFETLVNTHKDMVYSIALKIVRNKEDAEELAMDSFVKAYQKISYFRGDSSFSTWLYRITYNLSLSWLRKNSLDTRSIDDGILQVKDEKMNTPLEVLLKNEKSLAVQNAISKLNKENKEIISLFYFEEKRMKEVAEIMNLSESNIKVKLYRSRQKLYELLKTATVLTMILWL